MRKFSKTIIAATLAFTVTQSFAAPTNTTTSVTPAERAKIETVVREYLIKNPEVLVESLQVLKKREYDQAEQTMKQTQQTAARFATQLFNQPNDPVAGNKNGKVTITEFFDYQCPHCVDMAPVMSAIISANPDVRVVYKEFPIRGPVSDLASRAALAANMQGKYTELSHAMLTSTKPLNQEWILQLAKDNGLDVEKLQQDMKSKTVDDQLKANFKLGQDLKLFGTPAFFIGKTNTTSTGKITYVPGQVEQAQLQNYIDQAKA